MALNEICIQLWLTREFEQGSHERHSDHWPQTQSTAGGSGMSAALKYTQAY